MGAANDPCPLIGKQHWAAIGGERSQNQARNIGHHAVNLRPVLICPGLFHDQGVRAVHLECSGYLRLRSPQRLGHHAAVAHHRFAVIARSQPAIERSEDAGGMPALPPEETMGDAGLLEFAGDDHAAPNG